MESIAREYAHVNQQQPQSYYDYDQLDLVWNSQDNYEIIKKIGRGKYSEVFRGISLPSNTLVVIKVLKPIKKKKIKRELKILQNLSGGPNIISLLDIVRDPVSKVSSFIFENVNAQDFKILYPKLTDLDIRYYINELLKALNFCHSRGIIHRDVKPHVIKLIECYD